MEGAQTDPLDGTAAGLEFRGPSRAMSSDQYNQMMRWSNLQNQARDDIQFGDTGRFRDDVKRAFPNVFVFCCSSFIAHHSPPPPPRTNFPGRGVGGGKEGQAEGNRRAGKGAPGMTP